MREIKFRAFCTVRGMSDPFFLFSTIIKFDGAEHDLLLIYDNLQIVEFTGLKDKNGTEIYEGDIIKLAMSEVFRSTAENVEVAWAADGYWLYFRLFEDCEVIGNIHENSELLK